MTTLDSIDLQCYQNSIFQYEELTGRRYFNYLCNSAMNPVDVIGENSDQNFSFYYRTTQIISNMMSSQSHILNSYCRQALYYLLSYSVGSLFIKEELHYINYESLLNSRRAPQIPKRI
jgi:hypothetical protein